MQNVTGENLGRVAQNSAKAVNGTAGKLADQAIDVSGRLSQLKDQVTNVVSADVEIATKMAREAIKQIPNAVRYVESTVRRHPIAAAGIALGVGAVAVKLFTRSSRTSHT